MMLKHQIIQEVTPDRNILHSVEHSVVVRAIKIIFFVMLIDGLMGGIVSELAILSCFQLLLFLSITAISILQFCIGFMDISLTKELKTLVAYHCFNVVLFSSFSNKQRNKLLQYGGICSKYV